MTSTYLNIHYQLQAPQVHYKFKAIIFMSQVSMVLSRDKSSALCLIILKSCIEKLVHHIFSVLVPTINCPFPVRTFNYETVPSFLT